jgi:ankyrin repeat protein
VRTEARAAFDAPLEAYGQEAEALWHALQDRNQDAAWAFKWEHPRFRGKSVREVDPASLKSDDARLVIAHRHAFDSWADLEGYVEAVQGDPAVRRFEEAVEAVVHGDLGTLRKLLDRDPDLVRARSTRRHHATLLHYIAANGVEGERQQTPSNAVEVAMLLLERGAEPDALAEMYDNKCTTLSMLVSSGHPAKAGLQSALAEMLLDHGAELDGPGTNWQSAVETALAFGYQETAQVLAARGGGPLEDLAVAAGLGRVADVKRLLPTANPLARHTALALSAQHGELEVVRLLLDAGENPSRYNPEGFHAHSTPLHQAVWAEHADVVKLLVERGASLDLRDTVYEGTPLDWAVYGKKTAIAEYLRAHGGG